MPKLVVRLRQQTPIMHFQYSEGGATIRGTELKPRLDRFLIQYALKGTLPDEYRMGDTVAMNYRVKIRAEHVERKSLKQSKDMPYFCMGADGERHQAAWTLHPVEVTFLSPHAPIIALVKDWISTFFLLTNFGYRKNQGFGCFRVTEIEPGGEVQQATQKDVAAAVARVLEQGVDSAFLPSVYEINLSGMRGNPRQSLDWKWAMRAVKTVYGQMKSGKRVAGNARAGVLENYAHDKGYSTEKQKMEVDISAARRFSASYDAPNARFQRTDSEPRHHRVSETYRFVKAMLGLADHYDLDQRRITVNVSDPREEIDRFEGPLLFKPIHFENQGWRIYIVLKKILPEMYSHSFEFRQAGRAWFQLETPGVNEFDLEEFMDHVRAEGLIT